MNIRTVKLVTDLRVFEAKNVSKDYGRRRVKDLEGEGEISPKRTPTGRCLLSYEEVETLADAL